MNWQLKAGLVTFAGLLLYVGLRKLGFNPAGHWELPLAGVAVVIILGVWLWDYILLLTSLTKALFLTLGRAFNDRS